jgi:hypothetical protein
MMGNIQVSWITQLKTAMEEIHLEDIWNEFKTQEARTEGIYDEAEKELGCLAAFVYLNLLVTKRIQKVADKLNTSAQSLEELCAAESQVVEWPHKYRGIPTFGSILVTLSSRWRSSYGGEAIATWDQDRKALPEAYSYIPATLAETSMSHLLVYYMCYPRLSRLGSNFMIGSALPWLVGHLYGKRGILWMLVIATHEQLHLPPSRDTLNSWFQGALRGMMDPFSGEDMYNMAEILSLSDPRVALERSAPRSVNKVAQMVRDTLTFLPAALIPHVLDYLSPRKWLRDMETLFNEVALSEVEAQYVQSTRKERSESFTYSWLEDCIFMLLRGDVSCDTLREEESSFIQMPLSLQCSFGSILVDFAKDKLGHARGHDMDLTEITDWDERRRQTQRIHPDIDSFVPRHFASMNLTEVLWYYVRYRQDLKVTGIQELVPWLVGHLYGIRGVFWMALLIVRLAMQPPKPHITNSDVARWIHNAMWSVAGDTDALGAICMLRTFVNKKRGIS